MNKKDFVKVSKIIFDYVLRLDEKSINGLLDGNNKLTLVEKNKSCYQSLDEDKVEIISKKLNSITSREDARDYIIEGKFNVKILKQLAKLNNIYIRSKSNKAEIIDKLVEGTIGARLKIQILKGE